jgi:hypothetical protein
MEYEINNNIDELYENVQKQYQIKNAEELHDNIKITAAKQLDADQINYLKLVSMSEFDKIDYAETPYYNQEFNDYESKIKTITGKSTYKIEKSEEGVHIYLFPDVLITKEFAKCFNATKAYITTGLIIDQNQFVDLVNEDINENNVFKYKLIASDYHVQAKDAEIYSTIELVKFYPRVLLLEKEIKDEEKMKISTDIRNIRINRSDKFKLDNVVQSKDGYFRYVADNESFDEIGEVNGVTPVVYDLCNKENYNKIKKNIPSIVDDEFNFGDIDINTMLTNYEKYNKMLNPFLTQGGYLKMLHIYIKAAKGTLITINGRYNYQILYNKRKESVLFNKNVYLQQDTNNFILRKIIKILTILYFMTVDEILDLVTSSSALNKFKTKISTKEYLYIKSILSNKQDFQTLIDTLMVLKKTNKNLA